MNQAIRQTIDPAVIARAFSNAAATYDQYADLQRDVADLLAAMLQPAESIKRILDIGSGTGYCSDLLAKCFASAQLVNTDIAEGMLRFHASRDTTHSSHFLCADAMLLPFQSNCFDLVYSSLALQWAASLDQVMKELVRTARPGAQVCISTLGPATMAEVRSLWADVDQYRHVNRFMALDEVIAVAGQSGLIPEKSKTCYMQRSYTDLKVLSAEMKGLGAGNHNAGQPPGLTGKGRHRRLKQAFAEACQQGIFHTRYEVLLLDFRVDK